MNKYRVEILNPAWIDLDAIADYHIHTVGYDSARKITDTILNAMERLKSFPLSCPLAPYQELAEQGYRTSICDGYACIYKLIGKIVYVYHIIATASNYPSLF